MWNVLRARLADARRPTSARLPSACERRASEPVRAACIWSLTEAGARRARARARSAARRTRRSSIASTRATRRASRRIIWRGRTTTWAELDERIDRLSAGLVRRGIGRKKSLILMMRNRQEFVELGAAAARAGAAAVSDLVALDAEGARLPRESLGRARHRHRAGAARRRSSTRRTSCPRTSSRTSSWSAATPTYHGPRARRRALDPLLEDPRRRARTARPGERRGRRGRHLHVGHDRQAEGRSPQVPEGHDAGGVPLHQRDADARRRRAPRRVPALSLDGVRLHVALGDPRPDRRARWTSSSPSRSSR